LASSVLEYVKLALEVAEIKFINICHEIQVTEKLIKILNIECFLTYIYCIFFKTMLITITAEQFIKTWYIFVNNIFLKNSKKF